ncbi:MAG: bifunctional isocitrate dehydrogenase kinase/phosphatase [Caldilineaceae bacterium]|nr:bifunctional isocitrate dehydrogenase kinase/phosphatase [Caldilineaceae bacterium]
MTQGQADAQLNEAAGQRDRQLAKATATAIHEAFDTYHRRFKSITKRARSRFERSEWHENQSDSRERLELYSQTINEIVGGLEAMLGDSVTGKRIWEDARAIYARLITRRNDLELAETFFNSVTRRIFTTIGVDEHLEFVWFGATWVPSGETLTIFDVFTRLNTTASMMRVILQGYDFSVGWADLDGDAERVAQHLEAYLSQAWDSPDYDRVEMLKSVFYRNKGAYLIGRIRCRNRIAPLVLPLLNTERGVVVDAVLTTESAASMVFSFTRSYFHVEAQNPGELVGFLKSIMPLKPIAELYTAIGYNKHGKTTLFRSLYRHMGNSTDRFQIAPGAKGMVMTVFTLPSYDVVFKVIKDRFAYPKTSTRRQVINSYRLVFQHDRVGRMVDAQEFENLSFHRDRFSEELIEELLKVASNTVQVTEKEVILKHVYTERRLYPLDLYIKEMGLEKASAAVIDYGNAIADLAAANIFPGDLFIKNFGVTRHGRVVFYDYDELCLLTDCNFRTMPQSDSYEDELSAQPWFSVAENDIFPEEFEQFLWFPEPLRTVMRRRHGHLFTVEFWQEMQQRIRAGELVDIYPYPDKDRLPSPESGSNIGDVSLLN